VLLRCQPRTIRTPDGTQLGQRVGADVVERPQDALAVVDGQREDHRPQAERLLERAPRRLADETGELPTSSSGTLRPTSIIEASRSSHAGRVNPAGGEGHRWPGRSVFLFPSPYRDVGLPARPLSVLAHRFAFP
jgi:hypothetical protein